MRRSLEQQLAQNTVESLTLFKGTPCLLWTGPKFKSGYGSIYLDGRNQRIHRAVFQQEHGVLPSSIHVDHRCHKAGFCAPPNPFDCPHRACVNLLHLQATTPAENIARGNGVCAAFQRRTHCPFGHELTPDNIYWRGDGGRRCKSCWTVKSALDYRRKRERLFGEDT